MHRDQDDERAIERVRRDRATPERPATRAGPPGRSRGASAGTTPSAAKASPATATDAIEPERRAAVRCRRRSAAAAVPQTGRARRVGPGGRVGARAGRSRMATSAVGARTGVRRRIDGDVALGAVAWPALAAAVGRAVGVGVGRGRRLRRSGSVWASGSGNCPGSSAASWTYWGSKRKPSAVAVVEDLGATCPGSTGPAAARPGDEERPEGLLLVQQLGGNAAGSPSTWQTAVARGRRRSSRTPRPIRLRRLAQPVELGRERRRTWDRRPVAVLDDERDVVARRSRAHVAAGLDQAMAVIGTWTATATIAARQDRRKAQRDGRLDQIGAAIRAQTTTRRPRARNPSVAPVVAGSRPRLHGRRGRRRDAGDALRRPWRRGRLSRWASARRAHARRQGRVGGPAGAPRERDLLDPGRHLARRERVRARVARVGEAAVGRRLEREHVRQRRMAALGPRAAADPHRRRAGPGSRSRRSPESLKAGGNASLYGKPPSLSCWRGGR